ncbi:MAG: hypothetical protein WCW78_02110 [Candidatus Paceibacterota bacterium]|jgi:hypothetical protein
MGYNVVFKTIAECTHVGVITWTSFQSKEYFDQWYDEKMRGWYEVVDEGVSEARAMQLCASDEATLAAFKAEIKVAEQILESILAENVQ